jgi:hypothetical protein
MQLSSDQTHSGNDLTLRCQSPINSSKLPKCEKRDWTRQVNADLTRPSIRILLLFSAHAREADVIIRQLRPDAALVRPIMPPRHLPTSDRMCLILGQSTRRG